MRKKILFLLISLIIFGNVKALDSFPVYFHTGNTGSSLTISGTDDVNLSEGVSCSGSGIVYPCFPIKTTVDLSGYPAVGSVICVSGLNVDVPGYGIGYKPVDWDNSSQAKGVAYIINTIIGQGGNATPSNLQYYWTEVLVNAYLGKYSTSSGHRMYDKYANPQSTKTILNTGKTYSEIITAANNYANADYTVSLSASAGYDNLTFTKAADGYYYSNPITISSSTNYSLKDNTNSKFSYSNNGNTYTFKIKDSDIAIGGSESFSITVANEGKSYYTAQRYQHNVASPVYQYLTLTQTVKTNVSGQELKISGSVQKESVSLKIGKQDSNKKFVSGAKLMFQTKEQKDNKLEGTIITSTNSYFEIKDIKEGTYYLSELEAPEGYNKSNKVIEIVVANDGKVIVDGNVSTTNEVLIINDITKTVISKTSVVNGKELPGATLKVLNANKEKMSCIILDEKGKEKKLEECMWISGEKPVTIVGLAKGKYHLVETIAPEGYVLNESSVEFEVKGDGTVTEVKMENQLEVEVPSTLSSRSALLLTIAMIDIALGIGIITYVKKNKIKE